MIANVSAHRRANAFAQALEDQSGQGTAAEQSDGPPPSPAAAEQTGQGRLTALATGLGELPKPQMDPEVKVVQRAQLVAAMEAMLLEGTIGGEGDPAVPEQRSPGHGALTEQAHWASSARVPGSPKASPRADSASASPPAPSAESPRPARTPCPATRCTASSAA